MIGKLTPTNGCWVPCGDGKEIKHESYQVAVGNATWVPFRNGENVGNVITTGFSKSGSQIIVCRGKHSGDLLPGKLEGKICYVPASSAEHKISDFEVLIQACSENLSYYLR